MEKKKFEQHITVTSGLNKSFYLNHIRDNPYNGYYKLMYLYFLLKKGHDFDIEKSKLEINLNKLIDNYDRSLYYMLCGISSKIDNEVEDYFEKALKEDTKVQNKWLRLELYYFYLGNEDFKAFKYLNDALEIDDNFCLAIIEDCLSMDAILNANEIIKKSKLIPESYKDANFLNFLGVVYFNKNEINLSIKTIKESIIIEENSDNLYSLGNIYFLQESNLVKNLNIDAINSYAWLLFDKGEYNLAEEQFKKLLSINNDQTVFDQVIDFYIRLGKFQTARKYLNESFKYNLSNYSNDGYEIILNKLSGYENSDLMNKYEKKYYQEEIEWLHATMLDYGAQGI